MLAGLLGGGAAGRGAGLEGFGNVVNTVLVLRGAGLVGTGLFDRCVIAPAALVLRSGGQRGGALLGIGDVVVASLGLRCGRLPRVALLDRRLVAEAALALLGQVARTAALQHLRDIVDAQLVLLGGVVGRESLGSGDSQDGCYKRFELKHFCHSMDVLSTAVFPWD